MLKITLLIIVSIFCGTTTLFSQTTELGFSFQGYAVDINGKALVMKTIQVKFQIENWTETHANVVTDNFGVFNAIIGGNDAAGFKQISFNDHHKDKIQKLRVLISGEGITETEVFNAPLLSVPYARSASNGAPVGTIISFAGSVAQIPHGWLLCDGSLFSNTEYPQLATVLGSTWGGNTTQFNLPMLMGKFLRGVDKGSGFDPDASTRTASKTGGATGDNVGTTQGGATALPVDPFYTTQDGNHQHGYTDKYIGATPNTNSQSYAFDRNYYPGHDDGTKTALGGEHAHQIIGGDNETRPVNAAVNWIIKF